MLRIKNTPEIESIFAYATKNPILNELISMYEIDDEFVYFPNTLFRNKDFLRSQLILGNITDMDI